jgi:hypothetical protein
MSKCKSCVHWVPFNIEDGVPRCGSHLIIANRLGLCRKVSDEADRVSHESGELEPDGTMALCADGSDYRHDLRTSADFGCVLWEAK